MRPDYLLKGDMIMLPKQGGMPTRNVLLTDAEAVSEFSPDGEKLFWVSWLGDDGLMQEDMIVNPSKVTLIARKEQ